MVFEERMLAAWTEDPCINKRKTKPHIVGLGSRLLAQHPCPDGGGL